MNYSLSIKEEFDVPIMHNIVKTEEFTSLQNNISLKDDEYFGKLKNCENRSVENWKSITWKCFYCNHKDSNYEILKLHLQSMHQISDVEDVHYQCNVCEESVTSYASFLNHIRCVHYETLKLCCDICNNNFSNYGELAIHREEHIESLKNVYPIVYHCSLCEKVYSTQKDLKEHIQISHTFICSAGKNYDDGSLTAASTTVKDEFHETEPTFQCGICVKAFLNELDYQNHLHSHTNDRLKESEREIHKRRHTDERPFKCEICSKTFIERWNLKNHLIIHTEERPFKCESCEKSFKSKEELKRHLRTHTGERPYKCELCSKSFVRTTDLRRHFRTHTEDRPFQCELCEKSFKSTTERKRHLRIHTGERLYKCKICSNSFVQSAHLQNHLLSHTEERPFKCELCAKSFKRDSGMKFHMLTHIGDRPFKCEICEKCFKSKTERTLHMRMHTGERPYKCESCSKTFIRKQDLQIHRLSHTKERPFKCELCEKSFKSKAIRKRHKMTCKGALQAAEIGSDSIESKNTTQSSLYVFFN